MLDTRARALRRDSIHADNHRSRSTGGDIAPLGPWEQGSEQAKVSIQEEHVPGHGFSYKTEGSQSFTMKRHSNKRWQFNAVVGNEALLDRDKGLKTQQNKNTKTKSMISKLKKTSDRAELLSGRGRYFDSNRACIRMGKKRQDQSRGSSCNGESSLYMRFS